MDHEFANAAEWMSEYTRSLAKGSVAGDREPGLLSESDLERGGVPKDYKYDDYMRTENGNVPTFGQLQKKPLRGRFGIMPNMPMIYNDEPSSQKTSTRLDATTDTATLTADSEFAGRAPEEGIEGFHRRDNDGDKMERSGLPPNGYYQLPVTRSKEMNDQFFGPRNKNIFHIADKTNTHIARPTDADACVLEIWGEQENVDQAKELLKYLQIHVDKDIQATARKATPWAKVKAAPTTRKRDFIRVQENAAEDNKRFRNPPESNAFFRALGAFSWPSKEIAPSVLGMQQEALDPIRFACACHIIWSGKKSAFRVLGDDPAKVQDAVNRLYIVFCELAVKNRNPTRMHLVVPPSITNLCSEVSLDKHHSLRNRQLSVKRLDANTGVQCKAVGAVPERMLKAWPQRRLVLLRANEVYLRKAMAQAVRDLFYIRGHAKMRVYFGTLVLFAYKRPKGTRHSLEEFMSMMRNHQTTGEVIRYIGDDRVGMELIEYCDQLTDMFLHVNPQIDQETPTYEPSYSASFDILLQDESQHHLYVKLEVEFERIPDTDNYRAGARRWLEIRKGNDGLREDHFMRRKVLLDIKYLDLDHDMAYQFEVMRGSYRRDTDIYPIFGEFVHRLRLDKVPDIYNNSLPIRRISYTNLPGMTVESVVQKTKYQYWMSKTSYIFEITKYEYLPTGRVNEMYKDGMAADFRDVQPDTRYGASLYSCHWDSILSKQAGLDVGVVGGWTPDLESFFKNYGVGGFGAVEPTTANRKGKGKMKVKEEYDDEGNGVGEKDGFGQLLDRIEICVDMIHRARARVKKKLEEAKKKKESGGGSVKSFEGFLP